jgi:hypothetical protein
MPVWMKGYAFADPKLKHRRMRVELSQKSEPRNDPMVEVNQL